MVNRCRQIAGIKYAGLRSVASDNKCQVNSDK